MSRFRSWQTTTLTLLVPAVLQFGCVSAAPAPSAARQSTDSSSVPHPMGCDARVPGVDHVAREFDVFRFALPAEYRIDEGSAHLSHSRLWVAPDSSLFFLGIGDSLVRLDEELTHIVLEEPCSLAFLSQQRYVELLRITPRATGDTAYAARLNVVLGDGRPLIALVAGRTRLERARLLGSLSQVALNDDRPR